jgi:cytochrome c-type biogenesis protein CcmH
MTSRRDFLTRLAGGSAVALLGASRGNAQQRGGMGKMHDSSIVRDSTNLFAMDQQAAQQVARPPKPGATASMTPLERDALERRIHCQCGCTLDVFTCRTTDFSCQVSPAMHRDVVALVQGGYSAQEIIDAFVGTYGQRVLMAPTKSGFNLVAWFTPGIALLVGAAAVAIIVRRLKTRSSGKTATPATHVDATSDELSRLEAAVKGDGDA